MHSANVEIRLMTLLALDIDIHTILNFSDLGFPQFSLEAIARLSYRKIRSSVFTESRYLNHLIPIGTTTPFILFKTLLYSNIIEPLVQSTHTIIPWCHQPFTEQLLPSTLLTQPKNNYQTR